MYDVQVLLSHQEILILKELLEDENDGLQYKVSRCKEKKAELHSCDTVSRNEILEMEKQAKQRLIDVKQVILKLNTSLNKMAHMGF